jgi:predicted AlkP superfamily pyrophosphatase or phosphodiesterase
MVNRYAKTVFVHAGIICAAILVFLVPGRSEGASLPKSRLLVFIVADQFPYDYITRFRPLFTGGIKRLMEEGVSFENAWHDHANTATCPGHASLATGSHPGHSGIVSNWWFDRKTGKTVYCVEDTKCDIEAPGQKNKCRSVRYDRSPKNLLVTGIGDWVKKNNQEARVYAASAKDRAAILLGGKRPDGVFWYNKKNGWFETNRFYSDGLPKWTEAFNRKGFLNSYFGTGWSPAAVDSGDARKAGIIRLDEGAFPDDFPHALGDLSFVPSEEFYTDVINSSPYADAYLSAFAKELILSEGLGKDDTLDYLGLSFSSLDYVGHKYGPNSPEVLDTVLHLDRVLKEFFDFLDEYIGPEHLLIVFTSDHGVQPFPEYLQGAGETGHRLSAQEVSCVQRAGLKVREHFKDIPVFKGNFYLDTDVLKEHGIAVDEVDTQIRTWLNKCSFIERVWSKEDLVNPPGNPGPYHDAFRNNYHPERSGDYFIQLKEKHLDSLVRGTDHGSPYGYDSHVPMIVLGGGTKPQTISGRVATVDLAPTIANLLNIPYPDGIDGKDRSGIFKQR